MFASGLRAPGHAAAREPGRVRARSALPRWRRWRCCGRRVRDAAARHGRAEARVDGAREPGNHDAGQAASTRGRRRIPGFPASISLIDGAASFALHLEIAARAERTLDVQYFLLQQDDTGKLLLEALLEAADRGVRVRLLLDDAEAFDKGSTIRPLAAHPNIEIRIFNPFVVRRELSVFRWAEFIVGSQRLNYRMHNKLFIGDNAIAVTGGRNIGDAYFQASTVVNFGDFDLVVAGPMVRALSHSFDVYWNDRLAIPGRDASARQAVGGGSRGVPQGARRAQGEDGRRRTTCARFRSATVLRGHPVRQAAARLGEGDARLRHAGQGAGRTGRRAGTAHVAARGDGGRRRAARAHHRLAVSRPGRRRRWR